MSARSQRLALASLILVVLTAVGCGGYKSPASPTPMGGSASVTITIVGSNGSLSFSPNPASVTVGQTVSWYNADTTSHDPVADGGSFDAGNVVYFGSSSPITMSTAGSFSYHDKNNPSMVGTLVVTQ